MEQNTLEITERSEVFEFANLRDLVNQALQQTFGENPNSNGLSSGFKDIDKLTSGFKKGQLTTIAVRAGMGKTALMLSIANNVAIKNNHTVAIFSTERSRAKITNRIIESETGMSIQKLQNGPLKPSERDHMMSLINYIAKANLLIDDSPSLSAEDLRQKSKQLKSKHNIDLIIIDFLELLYSKVDDQGGRDEQLANLVSVIKEIAADLQVPIILFSQIQGAYSGNAAQKATLKDLPAYLINKSDVVMFLHRSDLYDGELKKGESSTVELIVSKIGDQKTDIVVPVKYIESLAKFTEK